MHPITRTEFTLLSALLMGGAWFLMLRSRNRRPGLTFQQVQDLRRRGALILDVRTPGAFSRGHARGAKNIPLAHLKERLGELDPDQPVLTCCATGARSGSARGILLRAGFREVHDLGPWTALRP